MPLRSCSPLHPAPNTTAGQWERTVLFVARLPAYRWQSLAKQRLNLPRHRDGSVRLIIPPHLGRQPSGWPPLPLAAGARRAERSPRARAACTAGPPPAAAARACSGGERAGCGAARWPRTGRQGCRRSSERTRSGWPPPAALHPITTPESCSAANLPACNVGQRELRS